MTECQLKSGELLHSHAAAPAESFEVTVARQQQEIDTLKRERIDLLHRIKALLESVEEKEQEKAQMLAFCRESNDKSAACLREVSKLRRQLDKQRKRVRILQQQQQKQQQQQQQQSPLLSDYPACTVSTQTELVRCALEANGTAPLMQRSLGNLNVAAATCTPDSVGLAGPEVILLPPWSVGSPAWLADRFLPSLGLRQLGPAFLTSGIDLQRLLALKDKRDLLKLDQQQSLGISRRRHRRSLLLGIDLLRRLHCDWDSLDRLRCRALPAVPLMFWSNSNVSQWLIASAGCQAGKPGVTDDTSGLHGALLVWSPDWQRLLADALKHQPHHLPQQQQQQSAALAEMDRLVRESLAMRPDELDDIVLGSSVVSGSSGRLSGLPNSAAPFAVLANDNHLIVDCVNSSGDEEQLVDLSSVTLTSSEQQQQQQPSQHKQPSVVLRRFNNNNNNGSSGRKGSSSNNNGRLSLGAMSPVRLAPYRDTMI